MRPSRAGLGFLCLAFGLLVAEVARAGVEVLQVERGPTDHGGIRKHRIRATLTFLEESRIIKKPLSFWERLEISRVGTSFVVPPEDLLVHAPSAGGRGSSPWQIIVLIDASRSMLKMEDERRRFEVALDALENRFLGALTDLDVEVAIEPFDCTLRWAEAYAPGGGVRWMADLSAMRAKVASLRQRFREMMATPPKKDRQGMCTALYQAISEADQAMIERRRTHPSRQPLLVVIGDGENDLADGPGRVWDAGYPPRPFTVTELLASPSELAGQPPHGLRDLFPLYERSVEEGLAQSREAARKKLLQSYQAFLQRSQEHRYLRWAVAVGQEGADLFDEEVTRALGRPPIAATSPGQLEEALSSLASRLHEQVRVSFPTDARDPSELNDMAWSFRFAGQDVGSFTPSSIISVATDIEPRCESWESYCMGRRPEGSVGLAFAVVMAVLVLLWFFVPRYLFEEAR